MGCFIIYYFQKLRGRFSNSQLNYVIWYKNRIFLLKKSTMNIGYVYSIYKVCCNMSVSKALHSFNFQNFPFFYKLKTDLTFTCITKFCISLQFVCAIVCAFVCAFVYVIRLHCPSCFSQIDLK